MTGKPLHLLVLDWKQAFGSVDHTTLKIALQRFGVADNIQDIVDSIYTGPTFEVKGPFGDIAQGTVGSGRDAR